MGFLGGLGKVAGSLLFGGVGGLLGLGGSRKLVQPRPVTRDEARATIEADDALRRRKGAAADMITGTRGAEATASSIGRLVVGS